jgi:hypothetical protein
MLHRNALIRSFHPTVLFGVERENDPEPEIECRPWLELRGKLIEPIRDIAYITGIRPAVEVIANFAP